MNIKCITWILQSFYLFYILVTKMYNISCKFYIMVIITFKYNFALWIKNWQSITKLNIFLRVFGNSYKKKMTKLKMFWVLQMMEYQPNIFLNLKSTQVF